ncbi:NRDE family protein [Spirosoma sp. 209]|uniref:NRDE family protein n=1 Tax=Spirosoma sp. 209 TaxID=1955701 RepID=UPI00098D3F45|nr:NRDE family protein [Spirosoma sp. 209]
MCTATYVPLATNGFILTHSRDEKAIRPAARPPKAVSIGDQAVIFPQDPQSQGTWIASSARTTVCLLNGAFVPHQVQPAYKQSRGLVIPHFFTYPSINAFSAAYDFDHIEPFTLLVAEAERLTELRWTGQRLFTHEKDPNRAHIWSSVTLYTPDMIKKREGWFGDWLPQHPNPTVDDIRHFHQSAGDGDAETSIRMNRQHALLTISLTSIVQQDGDAEFIYEDFTQSTFSQQTIRPAYAIA